MEKYNKQKKKYDRIEDKAIQAPPRIKKKQEFLDAHSNVRSLRNDGKWQSSWKMQLETQRILIKEKETKLAREGLEDPFPKVEYPGNSKELRRIVRKPKLFQFQSDTVLEDKNQEIMKERKLRNRSIPARRTKNYQDYVNEKKSQSRMKNRFMAQFQKIDELLHTSPYIRDNVHTFELYKSIPMDTQFRKPRKKKFIEQDQIQFQPKKKQSLDITLLGLKKEIVKGDITTGGTKVLTSHCKMNDIKKSIILKKRPLQNYSKELSGHNDAETLFSPWSTSKQEQFE